MLLFNQYTLLIPILIIPILKIFDWQFDETQIDFIVHQSAEEKEVHFNTFNTKQPPKYSQKLIELHRENIGERNKNNAWKILEISNETWPWLDTLQPYNFDLCMRRYAREFHANPVLRDREYPVPFSIFSRNTTIFMTLFQKMFIGTLNPNYSKWFKHTDWKIKFDGEWKTCSTVKGIKGNGDVTTIVIGIECQSVVSHR